LLLSTARGLVAYERLLSVKRLIPESASSIKLD
jgi:hypothetical protein